MTFQTHSLGSFVEPKEVARTYNYYYFYPYSPDEVKRNIHRKYYKKLKLNYKALLSKYDRAFEEFSC